MKHFYCCLILGVLGAEAALAQQQLPPPTITAVSPGGVVSGSPDTQIRVEGTRFTQFSRLIWRPGQLGSANLNTTFVSENLLLAVIPSTLLTQAGEFTLAVSQPGDAGFTLTSGTYPFVVNPGISISTPCPLPNAIVGRAYEAQFTPLGGLAPYVWSIASGNLPDSQLAFSLGVIRGTPRAPGESSFTVRVTDAQNNSATKACSLKVVATTEGQTLFITQIEPAGVLAGSVATQIRIRGDGFGSGNTAVWNTGTAGATDLQTVWDGDPRFLTAFIPQNLLANAGTFPIAVRGIVLTRTTFSNSENFIVSPPVQVTTPCPLRDAPLRTAFSQTLTASGGFPPYTWSVPTASLPPGITLRTTGELTGTPTEAGVYDLALSVTDSRGNGTTRTCALRVLGPLTASPTTLTFNADSQGIPPAPQVFSIAGSATGLPFTAQAAVETGVAWLRVVTDTSRMPALVRVIADPGALGPGVYRGSVIVSAEASTNRTVTVPVTLVIGNVQTSAIVPRPLALRFAAGRGTGSLPWQSILLTDPGPQSLDFTVETTAPWLSATPNRGLTRNNQPALVKVRASAQGLATGTYRAFVKLSSAGRDPVNVPVTLSVGLSPETLVAAQSGITFTAVQGGPAPSTRPVHVLSNGGPGYFWEASTGTTASRPFVSVNPPSNASRFGQPSSTEVRADAENLPTDIYFGDVRLTSSNTDNSPRLVSTVLEVLPASATPFPELPFAGLLLTATAGGATTTAQGVTVRNIARTPIVVDYQLVGDTGIFTTTASATRTLGPGETRRIEVQANVTSVAPGVRRAVLYIQTSGDPQVRAVDIALIVAPSGSCTPTQLIASPLSLAEGFQVTGGLPVGLDFRVTDDCGQPLNSGLFMVVPSNQSGIAALQPSGDGRWSGTWPVIQNTASGVALNYYLEDLDRNLIGSGSLTGSINASNVPVIAEDATLSSASFARGAPLAPGSLFAIFGAQLAQGQNRAQSLPLPFFFGSMYVLAGERQTPLFYAGDQGSFSQVNAVMPFDAPANTLQQIAVWRGSRRSAYVDVPIAAAQPAVFTVSQTGAGQGIIVNGENLGVIADAQNPVERGKIVVIYCEGLGSVNAGLLAGQESPGNPLATARNPVTVTIGGVNATVQFAGLTPGLAGLYQINAVVPTGVAPGPAVPVVVTSAGLSSEPVTIGVR